MRVDDIGGKMGEELAEATALLSSAKGPRAKEALAKVVASLEAKSATAPVSKPPPVDDIVMATTSGSDLPAVQREPQVTSISAAPSPDAEGTSLIRVPPAPRACDIRMEEDEGMEVLQPSGTTDNNSSAADDDDFSSKDSLSQLVKSEKYDSSSTPQTTNAMEKGNGAEKMRVSPFQASANKARGKEYICWAVNFMQRACSYRKIPRMSLEKNKRVLTNALEAQDKEMGRPSPFFGDLQAIVDGKARKRDADNVIPEEAVIGFRAAMGLIDIERDPVKTFRFGQKEYKLSDLFAIIDEEDGSSGSAGGGGSTAIGADGSNGSGAAEEGGSTSEIKGPHCMMRLLGILVEDDVRSLLISSRLQATRAQMDVSAVGSRSAVWALAAQRFRDQYHEVVRIVDHPMVAHCSPNIIHQPNISADKLYKMWATSKFKWKQLDNNWRGKSGNHQPWSNFCQGDTDTFLIGAAIEQYPELKHLCRSLIPDGAQREDDATGAGGRETEGADRSAANKHEGGLLHDMNRAGRKRAKKEKRARDFAESRQQSMKAAVAEMAPLLSTITPKESKWRHKTEEAESKSAEAKSRSDAIALSGDILAAHANFVEKLDAEEALGERGNARRKAFIKKKIAALEKAMDEEE